MKNFGFGFGIVAVVIGVALHIGLVFASGVNLIMTSDFGFTVAAFQTSPLLALVSIGLMLTGFVTVLYTKFVN